MFLGRQFLCVLTLSLALAVLLPCTIWDNIFSQADAPTRIQFSNQFSMTYPVDDSTDAHIQINSPLKLLRITVSREILFFKVDLATVELDFSNFIATFSPLVGGCKRWQVQQLKGGLGPLADNFKQFTSKPVDGQQQTDEQRNIQNPLTGIQNPTLADFAPLLFFYRRELNYDDNAIFSFEPDLFGSFKEVLPKLFILVNRATGALLRVAREANMHKEIPFKFSSKIEDKLKCDSPIQQKTLEQVRQSILKGIQEGKNMGLIEP